MRTALTEISKVMGEKADSEVLVIDYLRYSNTNAIIINIKK